MAQHLIGGVPSIVREVLYAPTCPDGVALLFEVALTHHNHGHYEGAVNTYMQALQLWERMLKKEQFPKLEEADSIGFMEKVRNEQRKQIALPDPPQREADAAKGNDNQKQLEQDLLREAQAAAERESQRQAAEEEEHRQKHVEAVHKSYDYVPIEGKIFLSLAVGSVYESASNDERALAEYLVALRQLQTIAVYQGTLLAATVYSCLGGVYYHLSQYDFAADYFFRALEIREELLPQNHVDVGSMLNNIGVVLHLLDRPSDSLTLMYRAQAIFEDQLPPSHPRRELVNGNIRRTKALFFKEKTSIPPAPFVPVNIPMIPGAARAKKFFAPKAKKKKEEKKKK